MFTVGITGGIGSGKTLVCTIFKSLGIPVYHADDQAKYLTNTHLEIRQNLIQLFGEDIYTHEGINRPKLSSIIFNNKEALSAVNSIIHPVVALDFEEWKRRHNDSVYRMKEAAILFESGAYKSVDYKITVTAPAEIRIKRVIGRDNISAEKVKRIMANQMPEDDKIKLSDAVIFNDETQMLLPQILEIHTKIVNIILPLK